MKCVSSASLRPLRADAVRNREKILRAAAWVFAQRGLDATLDEIADAAEVGVATLYRRFPDKDALVAALFENSINEFAAIAERARDMHDSWEGFVWFLEEALDRQCVNRGLRDVVVGSPYAQEIMASAKARIVPVVMDLIQRAQRDGYLRADLVEADVSVLEMMISSLGGEVNQFAPGLWRRYLGIILDGLVVQREAPSELAPSQGGELVLNALHASKHAHA
ncbi:MAG: TetR/AcrR family transcriptional regulator [Acidimicrobiaceae bacterium]|nr:TetR/AcrR family transcriptional regulator [Acidimicrobiaceae bacterium]